MNNIFSYFIFISLINCSCSNKSITPIDKEEVPTSSIKTFHEYLQGSWINVEDSAHEIRIQKQIWTEFDNGVKKYRMHHPDSLLPFVNSKANADLVYLTNKGDSLLYEVIGLNDSVLSLMHYPSMQKLLYYKK